MHNFFVVIHENALNGLGFKSDFIEVIPIQSDDPDAPPYKVIQGPKLQKSLDKAMKNIELVSIEDDAPTPVQIAIFRDLLSGKENEIIRISHPYAH